jgi:hypothetical protein
VSLCINVRFSDASLASLARTGLRRAAINPTSWGCPHEWYSDLSRREYRHCVGRFAYELGANPAPGCLDESRKMAIVGSSDGQEADSTCVFGIVVCRVGGESVFHDHPRIRPLSVQSVSTLKRKQTNDAKLIDPVKKIIDDTEFNDRHIFIYQSVSPESKSVAVRSRRVEVEYFSDSKKAEDLSGRLAKKVSEVIPKEFGAVLISRGDPKYGEKDQIGLWLCP